MSVKKLMPRIIEDIDPPFGPVAVMKYDNDGLYVSASDYAALLARHNALREAVAWYLECDMNERRQVFGRSDGLREASSSWSNARAEVDRLVGEG